MTTDEPPWARHAPDVHRAMVRLEDAVHEGIDPTLYELVRLRVAQLNHRVVHTERELAALELAEAVTVLTDRFVPDEVYDHAAKFFEEAELSRLIAAITAINARHRFEAGWPT